MKLSSILLPIIAVLAPLKAMVITATVLILADLIFGIAAAIKRKEKITSAGLRRTIVKIFVYDTCLVVGFLIETYLLAGAIPVSNIIAGIIGVTEGVSLLENAEEIIGRPIFGSIINKLKSHNDEKGE